MDHSLEGQVRTSTTLNNTQTEAIVLAEDIILNSSIYSLQECIESDKPSKVFDSAAAIHYRCIEHNLQNTENKLRTHLDKVHKAYAPNNVIMQFTCSQCDDIFKETAELENHVKSHDKKFLVLTRKIFLTIQ